MAKKDRDEYNAYMRDYMLRRYHERRDKCIEALGGQCVKCGSGENLQFDHISRDEKDIDLGTRLHTASWSDIEDELKKCQLLCQICHSKKTANEVRPEDRVRGEECSWTKLTEEEVLEIRERYEPYKVTQKQLAEEYGVSKGNIKAIVNFETWKHLGR